MSASPFSDDYLDAFADPKRVPKKITPQDGMGEAMFAAAQMLLQSAVEAGWKNPPFLQKHPILQPLRDQPEFRARLEKLLQ